LFYLNYRSTTGTKLPPENLGLKSPLFMKGILVSTVKTKAS
jgi:hypothetical protein